MYCIHHPEVGPFLMGGLHYTDTDGLNKVPRRIYFASKATEPAGTAYAVVFKEEKGTTLIPLYRANGQRLVFPEYAGLSCSYIASRGEMNDFFE